jgi:hypothetical protein
MLETIIEIERGFWKAAGDRDAYAADLAADVVHILPGLGVMDRDAVLGAVAEADPWASFEIADARLVAVGDAAAALVYRARACRPGQPDYRAAITSLYRHDGGAWRLALHQQTPLA